MLCRANNSGSSETQHMPGLWAYTRPNATVFISACLHATRQGTYVRACTTDKAAWASAHFSSSDHRMVSAGERRGSSISCCWPSLFCLLCTVELWLDCGLSRHFSYRSSVQSEHAAPRSGMMAFCWDWDARGRGSSDPAVGPVRPRHRREVPRTT